MEVRERAGPLDLLLEAFELVDRGGQLGGAELAHAAAVAVGERCRGGERGLQVALEGGVIGAGVQTGEVPADVLGSGRRHGRKVNDLESVRRRGVSSGDKRREPRDHPRAGAID